MSKNQRLFRCTPHAVFEVLRNGWLYPTWVVGATSMRKVDANWPEAGAQLHHKVGTWPLMLDDTTTSVKYEPDHLLVLRVRAWPAGEADVVLEVTPSPGGCQVSIYEDAVQGPAQYIPAPVRHAMLRMRNDQTLQRLAYIAESATGPDDHQADTSHTDGSR